MDQSTSPYVLRRWLALQLAQLRRNAGLGRPEVARQIGISRTSVGHLETARNLPTGPTLRLLLEMFGVPERLGDFERLVDAARRGRTWWQHLSAEVPAWFDLYLGLEGGAASLSSFDAYLIHGLLQTREYAEATVRADPDLTSAQIEQRVELRLGRQALLDRSGDDALRLWAVLDESVLHRRRGTPEVMRAQLEHLIEMSERPRIDIQVLRLDSGAHVAQQGGFKVLTFPAEFKGDPGLVYLELLSDGAYREDAEDIARYELAMTRLRVQAENAEKSRAIIHRAAKEITG